MHTFPEDPLPAGLMGSGDARLPGSAAPPGGLYAPDRRMTALESQGFFLVSKVSLVDPGLS